MHSMHQVRTMHNGTLNQQHLQQQQQQQDIGSSSQQSLQHSEQQKQQLNMTVLESLESLEPVQPAQQQQQQQQAQQQQPVLSILDPVQQTMLPQQQQQTVIHHLVPAPAPLLHQLQPSNRQLIEQQQQHELEQQQQQQQQQEQQQQQVAGDQDAGSMTLSGGPQSQAGHQRQRPNQIEGIVAEGGGPIVQWLLDNYEIADGESLPRSTVYNHYLAHCRQLRMSSVNAASFGKLIRSVFVGLKTRRLGTRGHSKYHYFGVRAKQHVRLDWLHEASEGRAGCSSAGMMRDSNDTNSNGSDGNCGSESDSTGNCSGRLSGSMSGHNHHNHHHHQNGNNNTTSNKRLKRTANNAMVSDDYAHLHQTTIEHGPNLDDLDQHHLHHGLHMNQQQQQPQQQIYSHNEHNATNGMYLAYPMNGYDKQDSFASGEGELGAQWATPNQYDLSSFRNHLGPNKSSLVYEAWPEREPGLLERQLNQVMQATDKRGADRLSQAVSKTSRLNPDLASLVEPFEDQYKFYYKRMVELLGELQFNDIEHLWSEFWHPPSTRPVGEAVHWTTDDLSQQQQQHEQQTLAYQDGQRQAQSHLNQQLNNALTFEQLYELTSQQPMIERINQIDCKLHSAIESFLVVDMLSPLPRPLVQHIRAFARNICAWTESAIKDYHPSFVANKIKSTRAFEHALRRYTSINHLSTASRAVWAKRSALVQMSIDLSRLDLRDIEHQVASLMNQEKFVASDAMDDGEICRTGPHDNHNLLQSADMQQQQQPTGQNGDVSTVLVMQSPSDAPEQATTPASVHNANDNIENNYASHHHGHTNRHTADESNTDGRPQQPTANSNNNNNNNFSAHINDFSPMQPAQLVQNFLHLLEDPYPANAWPDWCRTLVESRVTGQSCDEARNFILKWNFYISLILRELTLRSAPSLGSFQLIRLLFDEYMYYLVVSRLGQGQHKTSSQLLRPLAKFGNI